MNPMTARRHQFVSTNSRDRKCAICTMRVERVPDGWSWSLEGPRRVQIADRWLDCGHASTLTRLPACGAVVAQPLITVELPDPSSDSTQ